MWQGYSAAKSLARDTTTEATFSHARFTYCIQNCRVYPVGGLHLPRTSSLLDGDNRYTELFADFIYHKDGMHGLIFGTSI